MRAVLQRVRSAAVHVDDTCVGRIGCGMLVLLGLGHGDGESDLDWMAGKISRLRIFDDDQGRMNRSAADVGGAFLVVSQFTLFADCRKGNRPGFSEAAEPGVARQLYEEFTARLRALGHAVETGRFQETMRVELENDGPVTLILDSRA